MENSPLSRLPTELQDTILRAVLLAPSPLIIHPTIPVFPLPPISATCTELRDRSYRIFFGNNTFHFDVLNCDASRLLLFARTFKRWLVPGAVEVALTGLHPDWCKLGSWLRFMHAHGGRGGEGVGITFAAAEGRVMECCVQILRRVVERADEPWERLRQSFGERLVRYLVLIDQPEILKCLG